MNTVSFLQLPIYQSKLYDYQCQLIFQYIPSDDNRGHREGLFTAMSKRNHIYPINEMPIKISEIS